MQNKITPNIWFTTDNGKLSTIIDYYKTIFADNFISGIMMPIGDSPSGDSEICDVSIFGQKYVLLATVKEHHPLNDSVSFIINCEDQQEINKFWNYFTFDGKESQCGWCIDKFGLRWQVIPKNLGELMQNPGSFEVMMKQKKIVIEEYII